MTLVIEDGSNVANANSYVTLDEIRDFAQARNETMPSDDAALEGMAIQAMDYLEGLRSKYQGKKTYSDQPLQWPRSGVLIDCASWPEDKIPKELKNAQCQLCIEQLTFPDLSPSSDGFAVSREKVDVIEVEYAAGSNYASATPVPAPSFPKVDAYLDVLFYPCGKAGILLRVRRA